MTALAQGTFNNHEINKGELIKTFYHPFHEPRKPHNFFWSI